MTAELFIAHVDAGFQCYATPDGIQRQPVGPAHANVRAAIAYAVAATSGKGNTETPDAAVASARRIWAARPGPETTVAILRELDGRAAATGTAHLAAEPPGTDGNGGPRSAEPVGGRQRPSDSEPGLWGLG